MKDLFGRPDEPSGRPTILFVCTGNICRSPLAEKVLDSLLRRSGGPGSSIIVESAGLHAVVGAPMDTLPAAIAEESGAASHHVARQIDAEIVKNSSLILTMTRDQLNELCGSYPPAVRRSFNLLHFARILRTFPDLTDQAARLFDVTQDAGLKRSAVATGPEDDITDPYRRSAETHERVGAQIITAVTFIGERLMARKTNGLS